MSHFIGNRTPIARSFFVCHNLMLKLAAVNGETKAWNMGDLEIRMMLGTKVSTIPRALLSPDVPEHFFGPCC